jgi:G:T-mismatch repair DNA endonuclease (very short patch repair protein)
MRVIHNEEAHRARVAQLRALGYRVKTITLPDGSGLVLTSKKRFVCSANHCFWKRDPGGAPSVPWPKKRTAKKKRRAKKAARRRTRPA